MKRSSDANGKRYFVSDQPVSMAVCRSQTARPVGRVQATFDDCGNSRSTRGAYREAGFDHCGGRDGNG